MQPPEPCQLPPLDPENAWSCLLILTVNKVVFSPLQMYIAKANGCLLNGNTLLQCISIE